MPPALEHKIPGEWSNDIFCPSQDSHIGTVSSRKVEETGILRKNLPLVIGKFSNTALSLKFESML